MSILQVNSCSIDQESGEIWTVQTDLQQIYSKSDSLLKPARNELDDAFDWYEMEQKGLGRRFVTEIQSVLKRITVFHDSCAVIAPGLRRCRGIRGTSMISIVKGKTEISLNLPDASGGFALVLHALRPF